MTRTKLTTDGAVLYVLHDSVIFEFKDKPEAADATLEKFFAHVFNGRPVSEIAKTFAFVPVSGSLADARESMAKVSGAKDVFVTQTGAATEPVVGWLTDSDIGRVADSAPH